MARSVMPHWKRHHSGVVPSEGFPAHQGLDVGGDRAEFADLAGHPRRGHGQLGARAEEAGEVGEVGEVGEEIRVVAILLHLTPLPPLPPVDPVSIRRPAQSGLW